MRKNKSFFVFTSMFLIFSISMLTIAIRGDFTIEKYWKEGGKITFEFEEKLDSEDDIYDFENTFKGNYEYNGSLSTGNLVFNHTLIFPAQEYNLVDGAVTLDPDYFTYASTGRLIVGDAVDYNFTVTGGYVDCIIFNDTHFLKWISGSDLDQLESVDIIHTNIAVSGTFNPSFPGTYIFVWFNDGKFNSDSISLQFRLDVRLIEYIETSEYIEIDPNMLETSEGEEITSLGMDTSDWAIEDIITLEIDDKDAEFTIVREDDLNINYNNKSTKIPCWVLEINDHETKIIEEEDTYTVRADFKLWKSKYSGITLKNIEDSELYNSTLALLATYYGKYTVKSAENVLLAPKSSGIIFPFVPTVIGILILILYNKKKEAM